jgi:hypothetical protein
MPGLACGVKWARQSDAEFNASNDANISVQLMRSSPEWRTV